MTDDSGRVHDLRAGPGVGPVVASGHGPQGAALVSVRSRAWVGIAANPGAGRGQGRLRVHRLVRSLRLDGIRARIAWDLERRAKLVADSAGDARCRCLVAVGGDGTVSGLLNEAPKVPVTVLPSGTENLFARYYGLTSSPTALARTIARGAIQPLDLVSIQDRRFALMAGFGFDADVVTRHHELRVARTGLPRPTNRAAYVEPVLRSSLSYPFTPMTVKIEDPGAEETLEGTTVFLFNLPSYALGLPFAPKARGDDGYLDVVVFRKPGPIRALHYLWLVLRGLHLKRPDVQHRKVRRVTIASEGTIPAQLDGDPGGHLSGGEDGAWTAQILPGAVQILAPKPSA